MKILSIETSCDETGVALLEIQGPVGKPEIKILGNTLYSQAKLHEEFGGVFPMLAKREHQKNLPILLEKTLKEASENLRNSKLVGAPEERVKGDAISEVVATIDFIAVTTGPGLEPALWTGIVFAEELGKKWGKPVLPVNHMEGHICSVLYGKEGEALKTPALALLVSGGHTELVRVPALGKYHIIGKTLDDAVGEAFDKVARMLGLPYPGGPHVSALAASHRATRETSEITFPRPMIGSKDLNFSFSGLKTAVLYYLNEHPVESEEERRAVARAFEDAAVEVLIHKTKAALVQEDTATLIVAGGVAANTYLRENILKLKDAFADFAVSFPTPLLATDNAVMIALAAFVEATLHPEKLSDTRPLKAEGNLSLSS